MNLQESLKTAIDKMKNAKESYGWLKRNVDISDSAEHTRHFDIFKQVTGVSEILLRCFLVEKNIDCYKYRKDKKTGDVTISVVSPQDLDNTFVLHELCGALFYYNSQQPTIKFLEDVDFSCFFNDVKKERNLNEHAGVRGVLQNIFRQFVNLNKILLALDCNVHKETVPLDEEDAHFDFTKFYECMDSMNDDERKYILITDSLHDVKHNELLSFLKIPWSLIIDFDGTTNYGGLQSVMNENKIPYNKFLETDFTPNNAITWMPGRILYMDLCGDSDFRRNFRAFDKRSVPQEQKFITNAINKVRSTRYRGTVVITATQNNRLRDIVNYIANEFYEIDVIYLVHQEDEQDILNAKTSDDIWSKQGGNIANVNIFDNSIFEAILGIHKNDKELPQREEQYFTEEGALYNVKVANGKLGLSDVNVIQGLERFFEFIHLDIGNEEADVWGFFHGDEASWATIRFGGLPVLSQKAKTYEKTILSNGYNKVYTIKHSPGIGGSTLGRQISFDLSREIPVLRLKKYTVYQNFVTCLSSIYNVLLSKNPFLILVDDNNFTDSEMQDIRRAVQESSSRVNALFVKRLNNKVEVTKSYKNEHYTDLLFTKIEEEERKLLKERCRELLRAKGDEYKFEVRNAELEKTIEQSQRFALLINLYLLEEDFKLETYVERFLNQIPNDTDEKKTKSLLIFTALCAFFSTVKIPVSYYSNYLKFGMRADYINSEQNLTNVEQLFKNFEEGLLLKSIEDGTKWYGIKHYLIAEEILHQLMGGEHWDYSIPDYTCELIDMLYSLFECTGFSTIDEIVRDIITALFTDKTRNRIQSDEGDFTALLDSMDPYRKIEVIYRLAEYFGTKIEENIPLGENREEYKLLAHIYAQCARIRSKCLRVDENEFNIKQEEEVDSWINKTKDLIYKENISEYNLEDMLGRCYLERVQRTIDTDVWDEGLVAKALENVDKAINHFNRTIWFGSSNYGIQGKLKAIRLGIEIIKHRNDWGREDNLTEKLYSHQKAKEYLEAGYDLIREIDEHDEKDEITTEGMVRILREKDRFEQSCCPLEPSQLLQNLENLRQNVDQNDYSSQYVIRSGIINAYERKYFTNEYRRSQLIYNALQGDKKACEDAQKVFNHLEFLIKLSKTHEVSYTTYKRWFEYAKYMEVKLGRAYEIANLWKDQEYKRENSIYQRDNNLVKPYYYLFVITLLQYKLQQGVTERDVRDRWIDLKNRIKTPSRNTHAAQDWYVDGRQGMGQLYDRAWINLRNADIESKISIVTGTVVHFENNCGYIKLTNPQRLGSWAKPPVGQSYSKDGDVFFDVRQTGTGVISEQDVGNGQNIKFKVGFSYEGMVASQNSLERNVKQSTFITDNDFVQEIIKFYPGDYVKNISKQDEGYLNGKLETGENAKINSKALSYYSDLVQKYGSKERILKLLRYADYITVCRTKADKKDSKLSLHETGIDLESLITETREAICVDFVPDEINPNSSGNIFYLNGSLPNGMRGGLSSKDIESFGEVCNKYGGSNNIIKELRKRPLIKVLIVDKRRPNRCIVSLYDTCIQLDDLLDGSLQASNLELDEQDGKGNIITKDMSEKTQTEGKAVLPNIVNEEVQLVNCDFTKPNIILGEIEHEGIMYKGIVPNMKKRTMKLYEGRKKIPTIVKGCNNNEQYYILKIK